MKKCQSWMSLMVASSLVLLCPNVQGEMDGDWEFRYSGSTATITGYNGPLTAIAIPSTVSRTVSYQEQDDAGEWHTHYWTNQYLVTSIDIWAFHDCRGLTSVTIPDSVTSIGYDAFNGCSGLTNVTIPESVTNIESGVFDGCSGLTSVTIPNSVTSIGNGAFQHCSGLTSVTIPDSVTSIEDYAFCACSGLTSVTIPEGVTSIERCTFWGCSGLTSVTIPDSVTSIGGGAFADCRSLTSVTIPDRVTSIGDAAFYYCSGLTNVTIPESVTNIESDAFANCRSLTSVTIPNSVTSIGDRAFQSCSGLTSVTIPDSVTSIGDTAFSWCGCLASIRFAGEPPAVGGDVFWYVSDSARGYYTEPYAKAWEAVIDQDGKWEGLIMEKELRVDSANPAEGSLTLAWEMLEAETEGVTYSVWRGAGEERKDAKCVTNGLTGNSWEDKEYWKAEPVMEPLNYWVVAKGSDGGERESNRVETRHRYGVFVGVDKFKDRRLTPLPMLDTQAELFGQLARGNGGFPANNVAVLTGSNANKAAFRGALRNVAEKAQTGDYIVIFCNSHGGTPLFGHKEFLGVMMYDTVKGKPETLYTKAQLASDLEALATANGKNGLNVIVFMNTCYAGGAVDASPTGQNFAWIVACREPEEATHDQSMGAVFPHFLVQYGWKWGGGAKGSGSNVTFADLADYAMPAMEKLRQMGVIDEHPETNGNQDVLGHFIAGWSGVAPHGSAPKIPTGLNVERKSGDDGGEILFISCDEDDNTDYFLFLRKEDGSEGKSFGFTKDNAVPDPGNDGVISYFYDQTFLYQVAAINEHGISAWCEPAQRGTLPNKFRQWLVEKYEDFKWDSSTPVETVAAAAATASANGMSYEACYVAGVDPIDPNAAFEAELLFENGKCTVRPAEGEKEGRVYQVYGKKAMSDAEEWTDVTDVEDLTAEGWRFFRVGVELEN